VTESMPGKVLYEVKDKVAYITLSNPGKYNALDIEMRKQLIEILDKAEKDNDVRVIVIRGEGENFSAGADLNYFLNISIEELDQFIKRYGTTTIGRKIRDIPKPVIALVRGYCIGGGFELVQYCDIIIASENAVFGQPELKVGLIPGGGGTQNLPRLIGDKKAREMIFTGNFVSAEELARVGLINHVVKEEELYEKLNQIVKKILSKSPIHIAVAKQAINYTLEAPISTGLRVETELFKQIFETEDTREGIKAFLEKRRPEWKGK